MLAAGEFPAWALSLAYLLHMLCTVIWIGGLFSLVLFVLPASQKALEPQARIDFLENLQRRLDPLGWFCLAVLLSTGMFQMAASPKYQGFLAIRGIWGTAILIKHIFFLLMIAVSAYLTWGVLPALRRALLRLSQGKGAGQEKKLEQQNMWMLRLNVILSVLVLVMTALARAA
jgi:uncharacterized membrane protein